MTSSQSGAVDATPGAEDGLKALTAIMQGCWVDAPDARTLFPQLHTTLQQLMQDQLAASGTDMRDVGALSGITEASRPL